MPATCILVSRPSDAPDSQRCGDDVADCLRAVQPDEVVIQAQVHKLWHLCQGYTERFGTVTPAERLRSFN